jgi:ATP-dependent RNA helicase DDX49/DBP8
MIINWDTHRVGRTVRGGRGGIAISFVLESDEDRVLKVEERIGELSKQLAGVAFEC